MDVQVDPSDVASLLKLSIADIVDTNIFELVNSICPWGTTQDMQLINMTQNDADEEVPPIWQGIANHDNFSDTNEALHAFMAYTKPLLDGKLLSSE